MSIKKCNECATAKPNVVPYAVYEMEQAKSERTAKRLISVIVLLILLFVGFNIGWLIYESQFETVETTEEIVVDAENDGIANYIGNDGDIYNGESDSKENN